MKAADLVFVDPDIGLPSTAASPTSNGGQKYVFTDDLAGFVARGQSLVIHHPTGERSALAEGVERKFAVLRALGCGDPWALIFRHRSVRVYFVVPAAGQWAVLRERSRKFVEGLWGRRRHFELYGA